ncbi:hypothetical protein P153DRAFT_284251 [Dothidotthia symphoricarpi CBS 119687]|uniref:Xylanolytic transcriptional activator regulatory domain-containing protein n=1 Tax=Dothidotthia symphoricarpi CBS 119687 TaxID=1392245 RepID=A0A6A6AM38_9PLEO|nr:uncharacterized protein P153DRAFT_284251 [Dothidotthia symphoricarpi CBS 119687]KAF2132860.1 hypothetical protein P153DRAFT_284251 [Dothidotthia symphoricarpi CBS 119687]
MWIEPLYPILDPGTLENLVASSLTSPINDTIHPVQAAKQNMKMASFYLVMALGAINIKNFFKQSQVRSNQGLFQNPSASRRSAADLYGEAIKCMDISTQHHVPSILFIQILLLISIYSLHGPVASSQWQLAGSAMRMAIEIGLHNSSTASGFSEAATDQRNRVFWSAYAIEISLAYNLGRPPSIGEEHITAEIPRISSTTLSSILHIKHRQIQSRVISQVYRVNNKVRSLTEAQDMIAQLQEELDQWKSMIPDPRQPNEDSPYPYSFWVRLYNGTSLVLHRSSPLCPNPSRESLGICLKSAGAYIDNILELLRESNVPLSWMLVQGVMFAGLTMLITARTGFKQLDPRVGLLSLLVDLPAWTRKCSVCLAIMDERWHEDLLPKLNSQFEVLVNDTLQLISSAITSPRDVDVLGEVSVPWPSEMTAPTLGLDDCSFEGAHLPDSGFPGPWYDFELMRDIMGFDPAQTFWDTFPPE